LINHVHNNNNNKLLIIFHNSNNNTHKILILIFFNIDFFSYMKTNWGNFRDYFWGVFSVTS